MWACHCPFSLTNSEMTYSLYSIGQPLHLTGKAMSPRSSSYRIKPPFCPTPEECVYFSYAKGGGNRRKDPFLEPVDYFLEYDPKDTVLTLHFALPFKTPVKAKAIEVEVYDPEFFIDFGFAENQPVRLVSAPAQCTASVERPHDDSFSSSLRLDKNFMTSEANMGMGANFTNRIFVKCP